ncbi:Acyl-CoA synthase [Hyphomicrobiales bacterium]|nr:Acyl-CoA synthase [Hyphomicrobiales bacterium]CAH1694088.1 Acyl-CoA synthase [Hyphomicrobiales bacterium]
MRFDHCLQPRAANHVPLTPVEFLVRAIEVWPDRPAVVWRDRRWTYAQFGGIVVSLAEALRAHGVGGGDVVSILATNRPEMLAAHYAVPMIGAVLNAINTRLDAETVASIVQHAESRLVIADAASAPLGIATGAEYLVLADDAGQDGLDLLNGNDKVDRLEYTGVTDEWQPICLNYTSGTTGQPKGVVYHHRGAYLNALGNVMALGLTQETAYLWTLPMFHCNGWCHTWAVTAAGGLHVCIDRPDPALIFPAMEDHRVTHMACAPVVLYMMLNHPAKTGRDTDRRVVVATGGASPTEALIAELSALGFELVHLYGLTESYGPATLRTLTALERSAAPAEVATALARQGFRHVTAGRARVLNPEGADVPADGTTMGEIALCGNTLMAGYYRDAEATEQAFAGNHFRTGDLAVRHADGTIEIRDRSKDIIISGGENISSLEIESVLHRHPAVLMAAVVAMPHGKWGETPAAFIELRPGARFDAGELRSFCRNRLAHYKIPSLFVEADLPKTATGKIQKFLLRDRVLQLVTRDG